MANSVFTNGTTAEIAQEAISTLRATFAPMGAFATDVDFNASNQGDIVKVPVYQAATAVDYNDSTANYSNEDDGGVVLTDVTLNKRKKSTGGQKARNMNRLNEVQLMAAHMEAVASAVMADIHATITLANFGAASLTQTEALFSLSDVATLRKIASQSKFNKNRMNMVLNAGHYSALLRDAGIVSIDRSGSSTPLYDGELIRLNNFNILEYNELPANSQNLVGYITDTSAIAVGFGADTVSNPGDSDYTVVTDPATNMTFAIYEFLDKTTRTYKFTVEALYGFSTTRAGSLKRIVSA